jgi:hypothetical protein
MRKPKLKNRTEIRLENCISLSTRGGEGGRIQKSKSRTAHGIPLGAKDTTRAARRPGQDRVANAWRYRRAGAGASKLSSVS